VEYPTPSVHLSTWGCLGQLSNAGVTGKGKAVTRGSTPLPEADGRKSHLTPLNSPPHIYLVEGPRTKTPVSFFLPRTSKQPGRATSAREEFAQIEAKIGLFNARPGLFGLEHGEDRRRRRSAPNERDRRAQGQGHWRGGRRRTEEAGAAPDTGAKKHRCSPKRKKKHRGSTYESEEGSFFLAIIIASLSASRLATPMEVGQCCHPLRDLC
jgi:hypothetical protein